MQSATAAPSGFDDEIDFNYGSNAPGSGQPAQSVAVHRPAQRPPQPQPQPQQKQYTAEEMKARAILGMK